ncbi:MAG: glycosyltransferase [Ignavibacteriae bacterium]|nr:glycosyltransferase [Ignavibacteriota bacterium]
MIKVLELIDGGFIGGGQVHVLSLSSIMDKTEFNPVIGAMGGGEFEKTVLEKGIEFRDFFQPKVLRKKYLYPIIKFCKEEKIGLLHSHGGISGFYGRLVKKYYPEIKVIHSIHGLHYINGNLIRKFISKSIEQSLVKYTDFTICETREDFGNAEKIRVLDPAKSKIIPNGINLKKYENLERKNPEILRNLNLNKDDFIIGNISRFDIQKNQKLIIKSAAKLIKDYPQFKFILVGNGKLLDESKRLASEFNLGKNLIFTGEQKKLTDFYSVFDLFVFPTYWEGMPYVLLEAMAAGLPIVCSGIPSLNEVIEKEKSALTINPKSERELSEAIIRLYKNKSLAEMLSANVLEESKKYDESLMVKSIECIYREVMK